MSELSYEVLQDVWAKPAEKEVWRGEFGRA
jgi:hypothetical protein